MPVAECETLERAVRAPRRRRKRRYGAAVAGLRESFDQFRDFEERGDRFASWWGRYDRQHLGQDQGQGGAGRPEPLRPLGPLSALGRWFWEIDKVLLLLVAVLIGDRPDRRRRRLARRRRSAIRAATSASELLLFLPPARLDRARHAGDDRHFDDAARAARRCRCSARLLLRAADLRPVLGPEVNGAKRWIDFGVGQLQPSEFLKPFFVVAMAWLLSLRDSDKSLPVFAMSAVLTGGDRLPADEAARLRQHDHLRACGSRCWRSPASACACSAGSRRGGRRRRPRLFLLRRRDRAHRRLPVRQGDTFQTDNAMRTLTAGGLFGMGPGGGTRKFGLPEPHTDYIFSVIGEEFGLIACLAIALLYLGIVARVLIKLLDEESSFAILAAAGLAIEFGLQALINMAVNVQIAPSKGMTLPFISYGGSARCWRCRSAWACCSPSRAETRISRARPMS
jgi:cell division protein FtsW